MTYPQALRYIASFVNYEKTTACVSLRDLKLDRAKEFFSWCGSPQDSFPSVHVAGTKGKGSVSVLIASILREAGYRTGLYTSPHLHDIRERVRVLSPRAGAVRREFEGAISRRAFASLVSDLRMRVRTYQKSRPAQGRVTFFEAITALAFLYFRMKKVDCAVIETGLGGRCDATNTVRPLLCVITPISLDHTGVLGGTVRQIAREKAGIIKESVGAAVVCAPQQKSAEAVIRARCARARARFVPAGSILRLGRSGREFTVASGGRIYSRLTVSLSGRHQLVNAATAVAAVEELRRQGMRISSLHVRAGLRNAVWPARCEVIRRRPLTVIDGCQNRASAEALAVSVQDYFRYNRLILVLGMCADKDLAGTCRTLAGLADEVVLTRAAHPRACDPSCLKRFFLTRPVHVSSSVAEARRKAFTLAGCDDMILVCGSLFVAGEFKYGRPARC